MGAAAGKSQTQIESHHSQGAEDTLQSTISAFIANLPAEDRAYEISSISGVYFTKDLGPIRYTRHFCVFGRSDLIRYWCRAILAQLLEPLKLDRLEDVAQMLRNNKPSCQPLSPSTFITNM